MKVFYIKYELDPREVGMHKKLVNPTLTTTLYPLIGEADIECSDEEAPNVLKALEKVPEVVLIKEFNSQYERCQAISGRDVFYRQLIKI